MGKLHPILPAYTIPWLESQRMFWVATAPLSPSGRVNVSPKCTEGTFHIIDEGRVWYEDLTGSGVETISHLREPENGRITILFHAFEGPPSIVRIYGKGFAHEYGTPEYDNLLSSVHNASSVDFSQSDPENVKRKPGSRAVIVVDILEVMTTCGFSVPFFEFKSYRTKLHEWAEHLESHDLDPPTSLTNTNAVDGKEKEPRRHLDKAKYGMKSWWYTRNTKSIDGLPGLNEAFNIEGSLVSRRYAMDEGENINGGDKGTGRGRNAGADLFMIGLGVGVGIGALLTKILFHPHRS